MRRQMEENWQLFCAMKTCRNPIIWRLSLKWLPFQLFHLNPFSLSFSFSISVFSSRSISVTRYGYTVKIRMLWFQVFLWTDNNQKCEITFFHFSRYKPIIRSRTNIWKHCAIKINEIKSLYRNRIENLIMAKLEIGWKTISYRWDWNCDLISFNFDWKSVSLCITCQREWRLFRHGYQTFHNELIIS